jgi:hypothetical protein
VRKLRHWVLPLLTALVLAALAGSAVALDAPSKDELRRPTPLSSPEEVAALMKKRGISKRTIAEKDQGAREVQLVGALTLQKDQSLGFMPLLLHHMAVEHWFVSGLKLREVKAVMGEGRRCYVKLVGERQLLKLFSPTGGLGGNRYGNALTHGPNWKRANGYHERVYQLRVTKILWLKTPAEFAELGTKFATIGYRVRRHIKDREYQSARKLLDQCDSLAGDVGLFHWDSKAMDLFLRDLIAVGKPPADWKDQDVRILARAICRVGGADWPWDLQRKGRAEVERAISRWSPEARKRLAPAAVAAWKRLKYRHQRDVALKLLQNLGGVEVERLVREIAAAREELKRLKARFKKRAAAHDYSGMQAVLAATVPHQKLALDFELNENRLRLVRRDLKLCLQLEKTWDNRKKRLDAVRESIESLLEKPDSAGLPGKARKPRFGEELATHFLPQLREDEQRQIEKLLIARGEKLDPKVHWRQSLLLAELLTGVAGKATREFLPRLIARRRKAGAPRWQLDYLEKFARAATGK